MYCTVICTGECILFGVFQLAAITENGKTDRTVPSIPCRSSGNRSIQRINSILQYNPMSYVPSSSSSSYRYHSHIGLYWSFNLPGTIQCWSCLLLSIELFMKWEFAITIAYIIDVYRPMRVGTRVEKKQWEWESQRNKLHAWPTFTDQTKPKTVYNASKIVGWFAFTFCRWSFRRNK